MAIATTEDVFTCSNQECRVAETKKCVEGLELGKCPHFGKAPEATSHEHEATVDQTQESAVFLSPAERLTIDEAAAIVRGGDTRLIAVIGPIDAGKTSLVAAVYDLFQQGPVEALQFLRSNTLFAFEQACFHSRSASQRATPYIERTPVGTFGFYHLGIQDGSCNRSVDVLLADRSGEEYQLVANNPTSAGELVEVHRADCIAILVDGARMLDTGARHNLRSNVQMIIQGLMDGDAITNQPVAFVLTKLDLVQQSAHANRVLDDFDDLVKHVGLTFSGKSIEVTSFRIAASPTTDSLPRGFGVPELLKYWLNARCPIEVARPPDPRRLTRAISRFSNIAGFE